MKTKHLLTLIALISMTFLSSSNVANIKPEAQILVEETPQELISTPVVAKVIPEETNHQDVMLEVSYYCACELCCDIETGITASGTTVQEGRTIAMPSNVPFGTKVYIEELDHTFIVEDRGGYIKQLDDNTMRVDVYVDSHELALELGRHMSRGIIYY